ncbi:MAG: ATP-binding protein [Treponema sp.]|nr:ATP-binding protein [Treponema sp.]
MRNNDGTGDFWELPHDYLFDGERLSLERAKALLKKEAERRESLVHKVNMVNTASTIILQSEACDFENGLLGSMGMLAKAVEADRVCVWKNHIAGGDLYCTRLFEWSVSHRPRSGEGFTSDVPYMEKLPGWETILSQGGCINRLVREMSVPEREYLATQGTVSAFVAPVFVKNKFWGFVSYDYCRNERLFSTDEQSIMRSTGMLLVAALLRHEMMLDIQASADKLEAALKGAREASNAKSRFLANMSHEMRTPLNTVIGMSKLVMEDGGLSDRTYASLENISHAGSTLLNTVNGILDISKIEEGKFELVPVEYDVSSLINDAVTQNTMHIMGKPIRFVLDVDGSLPQRLYGDDLRIKYVFNNLLSNAFKYTTEGTVKLSIGCERHEKDVWMTVVASDTGVGIRDEDMGRLFKEYTKLDTKSNRKIEGTGLGLAIMKSVVEMMDGSVSAESEYGKGSVFTVRFKQQAVSDATIGTEAAGNLKRLNYPGHERRRASPVRRASLPGARVLVVDDVSTNLDVAKGVMKPYGMQIDCATSGQAAVDAIRDEKVRYDAIFMDHMMPEMDGIEAARLIRGIGTDYAKTVPIIAFTANAIVGSEEMFLGNGFQAYVSKPIDMARLDSVIREWVKKDGKGNENELNGGPSPGGGMVLGDGVAGLDMGKGLERLGGDTESYLQVLHSYVAGVRPLLEKIRVPSRETLKGYAVAVHGIKGSSANIGAEALAARAKAMEEAATEGDFDLVNAGNNGLIDETEKLIGDLIGFLRANGQRREKPKRDRPGGEALGRLMAACEEGDIDAADVAMKEIEEYEYDLDEGFAAWLRENVDGMNHAAIAEKIKGYL